MATLLYRLGTWSARRAWTVILAWALILGGALAGGLTLMHPFATTVTVPGAEFQQVVDDLEAALPEAAGGSASVVFSTTDGASFTPQQQASIKDVLARWAAVDGVDSVIDPFDSQQELDDAATKVADGRTELADGQRQIEENEVKLADGRTELAKGEKEWADNQKKLADGEKELNKGQADLDAARKTLDANAKKIETGLAEVKKNEAKLAAGQKQLDAARKELETGRQQLQGGLAAVADGIAQLEAALPSLIAGYGEDSDEVAQARQQLAGLRQQQAQLQEQLAPLEAGAAKLAAEQKTLDAGKKQLAAGRAKLVAGQKQIDAGRAKLNSGQATLDANRKKLEDGKKQLADGRKKLDDAAVELDDGDRKLAEARQELADGEADLVRGERQLALTQGLRMVSENGQVAVSRVTFTTESIAVSEQTKDEVVAAGDALAASGVTVDYAKEISASTFVFSSEFIGLAVAAAVLLVLLGSLVAAGLPLLTALVGVGVGMMGILATTAWVELTEFTPVLAMMLGVAVGIDYALFLVNRHREQLARGTELVESIGVATGTAGNAVVVAGMTVAVATGALVLTGVPFLGWLGGAAAVTIVLAVLVSITLTPALLRLIGVHILSPKGRRQLAAVQAGWATDGADVRPHAAAGGEATRAVQPEADAPQPERDNAWVSLVTRHPLLTTLAAAVALIIVAIPVASMRLWLPDSSAEPADSTAYHAYTLIADNFGQGQNAAMIAVAEVPPERAAQLDDDAATDLQLDIAERITKTAGVGYVVPAMASDDHRTLVFQIVPTTGPSDEATVDLVNTLRSQRDDIVARTGLTSLGYAGQTVADIDISEQLAGALPGYLAVVVGISLVLLLLVFRSVVVPLLATGGFLLSVLAALGAVVAVYQWGWLGPVFAVNQPSPVLSFLPTIAMGIIFGLAMDYQMFLVTGMRESWAHGDDARAAVRHGFTHGAKVVTAAALIMTSVFASFVYSHMTVIRPAGFALAVGVAIDAFIVRMTIMPALMHLLGERAWYLPRWLDRVLPNLDVEGAKLNHRAVVERA